jgi:hypothetical protein
MTKLKITRRQTRQSSIIDYLSREKPLKKKTRVVIVIEQEGPSNTITEESPVLFELKQEQKPLSILPGQCEINLLSNYYLFMNLNREFT